MQHATKQCVYVVFISPHKWPLPNRASIWCVGHLLRNDLPGQRIHMLRLSDVVRVECFPERSSRNLNAITWARNDVLAGLLRESKIAQKDLVNTPPCICKTRVSGRFGSNLHEVASWRKSAVMAVSRQLITTELSITPDLCFVNS